MKAFSGLSNLELPNFMDQAAMQATPVLNAALGEEQRTASKQLANMLIFLTQGVAFDKVINAGATEGEGLEAWRRLIEEYDARVASHYSSMLLQLMTFSFAGDATARLEA